MAEIECRRSRKGIFPVFGFARREGWKDRGRERRMRGRRSFSLSEYNPRSVYKQPGPAVAFPLMGMAVGKERTSHSTVKILSQRGCVKHVLAFGGFPWQVSHNLTEWNLLLRVYKGGGEGFKKEEPTVHINLVARKMSLIVDFTMCDIFLAPRLLIRNKGCNQSDVMW